MVALLGFAGCATGPDRLRVMPTGDPVADGRAERDAAPSQDRVLWDYRIATAALRQGRLNEARTELDDAILHMGGILANSAEARKARSLFGAESNKVFIGEPYERVMAYYYRGMLYWRDGQPDNARACYRSGQLIDSEADEDTHKGDYVLLDYLDGLASTKLAADGGDAMARAQANAAGRPLPALDPAANVLVFAEFGRGPRKYAAGEYGEQLRFAVTDSPVHSAALTIGGQSTKLWAYDDISFQATTRGAA